MDYDRYRALKKTLTSLESDPTLGVLAVIINELISRIDNLDCDVSNLINDVRYLESRTSL